MNRTPVLALALCLLVPAATARAQSLDYEVFKSQVEPIFLKKRGDHVRCVVCHSERSNNAFRLEKLPKGAAFWTEEQSRRNFDVASRLVVPGDVKSLLLVHPLAPEAGGSAYHTGGRQFADRNDPDWKTIARWAGVK